MGWAKRVVKKARKSVKSFGSKVKGWSGRAFKGVKRALNYHPMLGAAITTDKEKDALKDLEADESGLRSQAAKRLVDTQRQAGGAQIKFQTEEYE